MLVLSRKADESVSIDYLGRPEMGTVRVTVCEIRGDRVQLGFDGPAEARFLRDELFGANGPSAAKANPAVAEFLTRLAKLCDAQAGAYDLRDRTLLEDTAAYLCARAGEQV